MGMIQRREAEGGSAADAATDLIHGGEVQSGFTRIWEITQKPGCQDLYTLEWMVTKPEYTNLFAHETVELAVDFLGKKWYFFPKIDRRGNDKKH